ncbi:spore germination protein [Fictibacillus phosphorivorans]|uniref:spore germination protein n=1 Tax=Fictibacillus phosphorivorans TaxID=1221500 RepID=UPI00203EB158|nr:spore germination protein [Fictibacillus phosphorivorans]MCM3718667.1 spore germination protein [Fictibacillus phosphorivorans]MCM3776290.1 spore germination protein [Fictibacillus phosphorivorans]
MTFFKKPKKLITEAKVEHDIQKGLNNKSTVVQNLNLDELLTKVKEPFSATEDLVTQEVELPSDTSRIALLYIESIVDKQLVQSMILDPLFTTGKEITFESFKKMASIDLKQETDFNQVPKFLLQSNTLVFTEDTTCFYTVSTPVKTQRDITEPDNESIVRGAHDGFVENLSTNLALVRKKLRSSKLTIKYLLLGQESHMKLALLYVDQIANPELVKEVEKRVKSIEADAVYAPGNVEESIEDKPFSFFPQILNTERPDRVAANLMEGRVALLYDTSPTAHIMPVNFFTFYQSVDDYNKRWHISSFFRFIRIMGFFIALGLPAIYISIVSFHYEVIPFDLILLIKSSLEDIPYPPLVEALLMELTIEFIREASIRLPARIGSTIAIVGGLVIGDAVVKAGLVSNLMIIVVAVTAIAAYIVPSNEMSAAVRILRFPFMVAAATLGFLGIVFGFLLLLFHLCRLYTFGSPYFAPIAPLNVKDLKDTFLRAPFWKQDTRPQDLNTQKPDNRNHTRKWDKS